jgi:formylglycine-generating enzyme
MLQEGADVESISRAINRCRMGTTIIGQGDFPNRNRMEDGYIAVRLQQNLSHLMAMDYIMCPSINAWEWCSNWFAKSHHKKGGCNNPAGPKEGTTNVLRVGSYFCPISYCNRYRVAARTSKHQIAQQGTWAFAVLQM